MRIKKKKIEESNSPKLKAKQEKQKTHELKKRKKVQKKDSIAKKKNRFILINILTVNIYLLIY